MIKKDRGKKEELFETKCGPLAWMWICNQGSRDHRRKERRGFSSDTEYLVVHSLSVTVTSSHRALRRNYLDMNQNLDKFGRERNKKKRCEKKVKEARRWDVLILIQKQAQTLNTV